MLIQIQEPDRLAENSKKGTVVGIDFGTTNSLVSVIRGGKPEIVPIAGKRLVPSLIRYKEDSYSVGVDTFCDQETIRSIKRSLNSPKTDNVYERSPVQIVSDILRYLKIEAEKSLKDSITGAVITVPAYYDEITRQLTRTAAYMAGIPVLRMVNEPTAAALAYHLDDYKEGVYLVYDLGGGTFDVSVLQLQKGVFQVLAVQGDMSLGGDDFDEALFTHLKSFLVNLPEVTGTLLAREIKEQLSVSLVWEGEREKRRIHITRDTLNQLIHPFVEKTLILCEKALKDAHVNKSDLKQVVLVGGSTRTPYLQECVKEFFKKEPLCFLNSDEVVALGAAVHAEALITGKGKLLLDVTPFSLGIETLGAGVETILPRHSPLPCSVSQNFTTSHNGQTKIKIHVVQGEGSKLEEYRSLDTFVLTDIPPLPAGIPQIKVTFTLDADGILSVSAEEKLSQKKQTIHVNRSLFDSKILSNKKTL